MYFQFKITYDLKTSLENYYKISTIKKKKSTIIEKKNILENAPRKMFTASVRLLILM